MWPVLPSLAPLSGDAFAAATVSLTCEALELMGTLTNAKSVHALFREPQLGRTMDSLARRGAIGPARLEKEARWAGTTTVSASPPTANFAQLPALLQTPRRLKP